MRQRMANGMTYKSLAVLIDADNTSPKIAEGLFVELAKIGKTSLKRVYGDFSKDFLNGWKDILNLYAIVPHLQIANTFGKNSSDIALVIDAMDLLHSGRFDAFCVVSSDSDFTRLAMRIREQAVDVFGIGRENTPESFRQACTKFIYTENLGVAAFVIEVAPIGGKAGLPKPQVAESNEIAATAATPKVAKPTERAKKISPTLMSNAIALIGKAITGLDQDAEGWTHLGAVGHFLNNLASDFDSRSFGHAKLVDLVKASGRFDIDRPKTGGVRIRLKQGKA